MSLKTKFLLFTFLILSLTLFFSSVLFYNNTHSYFYDLAIKETDKKVELLKKVLDSEKENLYRVAAEVKKSKKALLSLNLISGYQDKREYKTEIFDEEKKGLLNLSKEWLHFNKTLSIGFFDNKGELVTGRFNIEKMNVSRGT